MSRVRVVMNSAGAHSLLTSGEVESLVGGLASQVAARAGHGFEASTWRGDSRVIGSVETASFAAMRRNSRDQTLLRALGGI